MGNGLHTALSFRKEGMTEQDVIDLIMPSYYTEEPFAGDEFKVAFDSWQSILHDRSPHFQWCKTESAKSFKHETCIEMFYYSMYTKLLNIHPDSKDFFTPPPPGEGRSFVHYMGVLLNEINKELYWNETLINLTIHHSHIGVRAIQYPVLGEIFMHAVKDCVGPHVYTAEADRGWKKIWSKILKVMVSTSVKFELDADNVQLRDVDKTFCADGKSADSDGRIEVDADGKPLTGVKRAAMMFHGGTSIATMKNSSKSIGSTSSSIDVKDEKGHK